MIRSTSCNCSRCQKAKEPYTPKNVQHLEPTKFSGQANVKDRDLEKLHNLQDARRQQTLDKLARINANQHSLSYEQALNNITGNGLFTGQCTLKAELEKNHQAVLLLTDEDAFATLKHLIEDRYQKDGQIPTTLVLKDIDKAKTYAEYAATAIGAVALTSAFGDLGVRARYVTINGKTRVSISTQANGKQLLRHVLVNGMRIKINSAKTYAIDNPKVIQLGLAPKERLNAGIKAGVMTMIISVAINTNDLIFNHTYDFYDWFGNIGTDFIKTALALYGAKFIIGMVIGSWGVVAIIAIAITSIALSALIDRFFDIKNVSGELTNALRKLQE